MLSQKNIDKLHMNGIYRCNPVLEWLPSYKRDNPYWCKNWTFKVYNSGNKYYMYDTYWSTGDEHPIKLTDGNFDKFEFLFDLDDIRYIADYKNWLEYPDDCKWCVPLDSGGNTHPKYVVRRDASRIRERVIKRMQDEIDLLKQEVAFNEKILKDIIDGGDISSWD